MEPYYDPATDRIIGTRPGTWAYAHEARHRWQFKRFPWLEEAITKVHLRSLTAAGIAGPISAVVLGIHGLWLPGLLIGVGAGMMPHVLLTLLIEADAYIMGTRSWLQSRG